MSTTPLVEASVATLPATATVDLKLEVVVLPVSDVDRAKQFYQGLGWRLDGDFAAGDAWRLVQMTPPGSPASIHFGKGVTSAAPGSMKGTYLVVDNLEAARQELIRGGAAVSEVFHLEPGKGRVPGPGPEGVSYLSQATFNDPDGNSWILQEVRTRLPGRGLSVDVPTLTELLRDAELLHGVYGLNAGPHHWSDWYASYIVARIRGTSRDEAAKRALHPEIAGA